MVRNTVLTASLLGAAASLANAACIKRGNSTSLVAATYFAGYHIDDGFPLSSLSWDRFTEVKYSFAYVSPTLFAVGVNNQGHLSTNTLFAARRPTTEAWTLANPARTSSPCSCPPPKKTA